MQEQFKNIYHKNGLFVIPNNYQLDENEKGRGGYGVVVSGNYFLNCF